MKPNKVKVSKLKLNPDNPRIIKGAKFKKLVKSIKEFPEMLKLRPIVVDENNIILGGNMRYKACVEIGMKEVYAIQVDNLTDKQKKEFIIKDNIGFGEWEYELLANEWSSIQLEDWGLDVWLNNDDLEEPSFNELTQTNEKPAVIKITFANENDLKDAEKIIIETIKKYDKAFYSVTSEK
tara:strand:- start:207 stop:746 length:540 start_codon:yes stop_codon:yes gene_type:complete